jgi:hypothetical protein
MADSGYAFKEACLSNSECDELLRALSSDSIARSRAGARHLMSNRAPAELAASLDLGNHVRLAVV